MCVFFYCAQTAAEYFLSSAQGMTGVRTPRLCCLAVLCVRARWPFSVPLKFARTDDIDALEFLCILCLYTTRERTNKKRSLTDFDRL